MKLKLFRVKKKTLNNLLQKKMSYPFSPEGSISCGSTSKRISETPEEQEMTLNNPLDTKYQVIESLPAMNAINKVTTKVSVQGFRRRNIKGSSLRRRRKVLWQHGMTLNLLNMEQNQKMNKPI